MFFTPKVDESPRVTVTSRVTEQLRQRIDDRAARSGRNRSALIADLLEVALEFEEKLEPFRPAIERLMREERLSAAEAVAKLLWMDVELNPRPEQHPRY
jgi:metal-responsive CopG/Arc/MetJ family transcriptional regulator